MITPFKILKRWYFKILACFSKR